MIPPLLNYIPANQVHVLYNFCPDIDYPSSMSVVEKAEEKWLMRNANSDTKVLSPIFPVYEQYDTFVLYGDRKVEEMLTRFSFR